MATARHMSGLWAGFAHTAGPTAPGVPRGPAYASKERATMRLDAECKIGNDPDRDERLFWSRA
jgi:para-nitrobenzyl esterase